MDYVRKGLVVDLEETDDGTWQASVNGNDLYSVKLTLSGEDILDSVCSCPDDLTRYCKHIIAVYLAVTSPSQSEKIESVGKPKPIKANKPSSPKRRVDEYVAGLSVDETSELLAILRRDIKNIDTYIAQNILPPTGDAADEVRKSLKRSLGPARRSGYFDYHASQEWLNALDEAFNQVDRLTYSNALEALRVCGVIYEVAVSHAGTIDDSNGEFSEAMEPAIERYYEIAAEVTDAGVLSAMLSHLLGLAKNFAGDGWFSAWSWLKNVAVVVGSRDEVASVTKILDNCLKAEQQGRTDSLSRQSFADTFAASLDAEIRYSLIAKFGDESALSAFVDEYSQHHAIRELYADHQIGQKKYRAARDLCELSIELDKDLRGVVIAWVQRLQIIAKQTQDTSLYKRTARTLFESKGDLGQLALLKRLSSREEWVEEYNRLVADQEEHGSRHLLRELYIFENKMNLLIDSLADGSINEVESYHENLKKSFPLELAELYLGGVRTELQNTTGRGTYQQCARALRRAKKLGKGREVAEIVGEMIKKHPNRRAMVEELHEV